MSQIKEAIELLEKVHRLISVESVEEMIRNAEIRGGAQDSVIFARTRLDQAIAILTEQPPASDFTEKLRKFVKMYEKEIPRRAEITFLEEACAIIKDYEKQLKAPEQPPAGKLTKLWREKLENAVALFKMGKNPDEWFQSIVTGFRVALTRLDRSEASRKELLTALRDGLIGISEASVKFERRFRHKGQAMLKKTFRILEAAIAKEKEVKK